MDISLDVCAYHPPSRTIWTGTVAVADHTVTITRITPDRPDQVTTVALPACPVLATIGEQIASLIHDPT